MKSRYQNPKILVRNDVSRPYYYILATVPIVTPGGLKRVRKAFPLGYCGKATMREVQTNRNRILKPINDGRFLLQSQIVFKDLVARFQKERIPQLGAATRAKYLLHLDNHLLPAFGQMILSEVATPGVIQTWINEKAQPQVVIVSKKGVDTEITKVGLGKWARLDLRNLLSAIFAQATDWGLWDGPNPCKGIQVGGKKFKREKHPIKANDLRRFLEVIPDTSIIDRSGALLIVITGLVVGLRVSEVLGLQPRDIDMEKETLFVQRRQHRGDVDDPKTEESRRERQIGFLAQQLIRYADGKRANDYIFTRKNGQFLDDRDLQQYIFRPAAEAAGIYHPGFGMHTFRRLNVTWRQEAGATPIEAQKAAGHASLNMTYLYTMEDGDREKQHVKWILDRLKITAKDPEGLAKSTNTLVIQ